MAPLKPPQIKEIHDLIASLKFKSSGDIIQEGRNSVSLHTLADGSKVVIKAFRTPNWLNRMVYRYFRKSKAKRSFEYANLLRSKGIGTPDPILYIENFDFLGLKDSYYISAYTNYDFTFRELTEDFSIPNHEQILRAFTRFTYHLHKNKINFLDHSPGNTLIKSHASGYNFFLVDLNRMRFGDMDLKSRVKNFSKLTIHKSIIQLMSNEYAKCTGEEAHLIFGLMWKYTKAFQKQFYQKIRIKRRLFFWKKKYQMLPKYPDI